MKSSIMFSSLLLAGALVSCVSAAEQTGKARKVIAGDYEKKRLGIVDESGKLTWEHEIRDIHDLWVLPNGNILFQTSWTKILEVTPEKKIAWQYDAGQMNGNAGKRVEVHAFQRLAGGLTMIAESGPARIIEVDREGKIQKQIKLKVDKPDPHRDTRLARKLENGHYLVCHEADGVVREYDGDGKVVWTHDVKAPLYSAIRLASGNTLIGCGGGNRVIEVDRSGKEVWKVEKQDLPGITLAWVTMVDRLPSGNTLIVNCHAGPENPQLIEVTPEKKVVWTFKDFEHFGNNLPAARVIAE